ncbi:BirA family biotin operon repressor/biotin-[acetyl-CoA-carboxylase] ligase [Clostridium saccharoperbutylacetonicum]|uniref:Bifunctional ligase/repressor BirA n=1 Tax=Clostridium saccharoperbutylacetonicum N1-4(HMT) TaxID=931276 RepID=M1MAA4_9CLOT|nr:biotin--[acetyl-CoA-carboxylase] ligase [Clostridium saccharoperbutylacetonicum]AGF54874.1 bifunctional protein BirA [Clostridium saccharoperbutylacetonicum N1-4(HMT)]NRT64421.1 BirA family biotin operon repressor/biotin-[acetyl-CoA-carboxylase] ligase [Clostridium saccharoperbutylacetonicum]NSB27792.1 BirA family biotin operon repressor/biotin-[acetyl-CoA-carboxylase] ligase [Clostridium saccharoperbutylacetonicum]NSB41277.1 BirA family biotin operon repressor/biotin-[acetyl-CoA-carboxylase
MEEKILNELKNADDYISGEILSSTLQVSRTAIWKHINNLKAKGYIIEGVSKKGYKLLSSPDLIDKSKVISLLETSQIGKNIVYFTEIDSTNIKAKELAQQNVETGSLIVAEKQTLGSGRFNREWVSPNGGLWFTLVLRPNISPMEAPKITQIAAASVYKTLKDLNIDVNIKWPNDIHLNGKKLCGILAEMKCDMDSVHYLVLGIGMNININRDDFNDDTNSIATSLKIEFNKQFSRTEILSSFLNHFEKLYLRFVNHLDLSETISICRNNSNILGKQAKLITYNKEEIVTCVSLSDAGDLIVKDSQGNEKAVLTGEISFKGM